MWSHNLRSTKSTTSAQSVGGSMPDAVTVDQHAVLAAVRPTQLQREKILGAHTML